MTRKIKIKVYGEEYIFKLSLTYGSDKCTIRQLCTDFELPCTVTDTHIVLDNPITLRGYLIDKEKTITQIKIPVGLKKEIHRYVGGIEI